VILRRPPRAPRDSKSGDRGRGEVEAVLNCLASLAQPVTIVGDGEGRHRGRGDTYWLNVLVLRSLVRPVRAYL
jgi:hypothetical protein